MFVFEMDSSSSWSKCVISAPPPPRPSFQKMFGCRSSRPTCCDVSLRQLTFLFRRERPGTSINPRLVGRQYTITTSSRTQNLKPCRTTLWTGKAQKTKITTTAKDNEHKQASVHAHAHSLLQTPSGGRGAWPTWQVEVSAGSPNDEA